MLNKLMITLTLFVGPVEPIIQYLKSNLIVTTQMLLMIIMTLAFYNKMISIIYLILNIYRWINDFKIDEIVILFNLYKQYFPKVKK